MFVIFIEEKNFKKAQWLLKLDKFPSCDDLVSPMHLLYSIQLSLHCNRCPHSILQNTSTRRHKCLESLQDFLQSATQELMWLNEREDLEISRDWSSPDADMEQTDSAYKVRQEISRKFSGKRRYLNIIKSQEL